MVSRTSRRSLGALFLVLAAAFAGIAFGAAAADSDSSTRWVVAVAAGVIALWLLGLAARSLRAR